MARTSFKKVWVARDKDGGLFAFQNKPFYVESWGGIWLPNKGKVYIVKNLLFEHLRYDDEPIESKILSDNLEPLKHFF